MNRALLARKNMFMLVGSLLVAPMMCGFFTTSAGDIDPPKVVVDRHSWDFNTVRAGPILEVDFLVRNEGGRRLVLNAQSNSCGCAASRQPTIILPPGCSRRIEATLDTNTISGPVAIDVTFSTNDVNSPKLKFTLFADVVSPVAKQGFLRLD